MPGTAAARAMQLEWAFAALNTLEPPFMDHAMAMLFEADAPWSAPRLPAVMARIDERLHEASDRLGTADWFGGEFGPGDLLMVSVLRMADGMLDDHPNLAAYVARGTGRDAFGRALDDHMAGFTGEPPPVGPERAPPPDGP